MSKSFTSELSDFMLGNNNSYTQKELVETLFKTFPHRSKAYIKVFIQKCTVNNPNRVSLGAAGNIFVLLDGKYSAYDSTYTGPIYAYDTERAKAAKIEAATKTQDRITHFKNVFKGNAFKVQPQHSKILVISQCTKDKSATADTAMNLYTGMHHKYIKDVSEHFDLYIISAGYGLIHSSTIIEPYDITFNDLHKTDLPKLRDVVDVRGDLERLLASTSYDLVVLAVSDMYLEILNPKKSFDPNIKILSIGTAKRSGQRNELSGNVSQFNVTTELAMKLGAPQISLKGKILNVIFESMDAENQAALTIDPVRFIEDKVAAFSR